MNHQAGREWDARAYDQISDPQFGWGLKVLDRVSIEPQTVIDAGCGSGRLTEVILDRWPKARVIALDRSTNMLEVIRDKLGPRYGERLEVLEADLTDLDLDQVADLVFSTATFHWILDHQRLYRGLYRALRPGGQLVAQCGGEGNLDRVARWAHEIETEPPFLGRFDGWQNPRLLSDPDSAARLLEMAGFDNVETALSSAPTRFDSEPAFRLFMSKVILRLHLEHLGDPQLGSLFLDRMIELSARDDPPYELDYVRLNLRARKP